MALATRVLLNTEIAQHALDAGFRGWRVVYVGAVALAESGGNAWAVNLNAYDPFKVSYLSLDLGIVQWNTYWYPTMTAQQAFDPGWSFRKMYAHTQGGFVNLESWNAYNSGAYLQYLTTMRLAARSIGVPV